MGEHHARPSTPSQDHDSQLPVYTLTNHSAHEQPPTYTRNASSYDRPSTRSQSDLLVCHERPRILKLSNSAIQIACPYALNMVDSIYADIGGRSGRVRRNPQEFTFWTPRVHWFS